MRDYKGDLEWYRTHQTTQEIGFNPDGMCLKVCRTSRDIGPMFLTAVQAQNATPQEHRHFKVRDLRKGMKLYFDDPFDSQTAGHICTMIGRVKGFDPDSLHDILVETNSVKSGELVVVRGDYFGDNWGDEFQFGATWLNGHVLDVFEKKVKPPEPELGPARLENFRGSRPDWDVKILDRVGDKVPEVARKVKEIEKSVASLPDDEQDTRVRQFVEQFNDDRTLNMRLLNAAVNDGRQGKVLEVRSELRAIIKSLLK